MNVWWKVGGAAILGLSVGLPNALGQQVIRRDTKVTGPRGRSVERTITASRGPGYVERDVRIQRPGGTFERDTVIRRGGGGPGGAPRVVERDVFVERDVVVRRPGGYGGFGVPGGAMSVGGPGFGVFVGSPPPPPPVFFPAPVVVAPPPLIIAGGGGVAYQAPPVQAAPAPAPVPTADAFSDAMGRLKSFHGNSRRDGALTLGRMGDPRAVPALIERLKNDYDREVRVASAWALGELGDSRAAVALQRAAQFDRKSDVREAAAKAYDRVTAPPPAVDPPASTTAPQATPAQPPAADRPPPNPTPAFPDDPAPFPRGQ